jgi:RraA family protein
MAERFRHIPVANISDVMLRLSAAGPTLRPYHAGGVLAGAAFTVKTRPGDNLMIHKALNMAGPGDVLVVDGGGDLTNSLVGEMMLAYAEKRGIAGAVLYGAIRDLGYVKSHNYPVFAAGVTHRGPYRNGPGEINVPVTVGQMLVEPGDLIVGDDDGLLCIPYDMVESVYAEAHLKHKSELDMVTAIREGTNDRTWVDGALAASGYKFKATP